MDCGSRGIFKIHRHFNEGQRQISLILELELYAGHPLV